MTLRAHLVVVLALTAVLLPAQTDSRNAERKRQREEEFYKSRAFPRNAIPAGARLDALRQMEKMILEERKLHPRAASPAWVSIGPRPSNVLAEGATGGGGAPYTSGRVTALAVDPRNGNVAYLGAAGGGVWKTTDGGQNWVPLTDDQASLATGSIALAPSNPDIVYVGTGEQDNSGDSYYGAGILKSTDGGATWTQISGPFVGPFSSSRISGGGARIGGLAVHPANPSIVLAAVSLPAAASSGIYRTSDGGATWNLVLSGAVGTDVVFNPSDGTVAYAALGTSGGNTRNGVYKSTDSGATWNLSDGAGNNTIPSIGVGRIALGIAPSSPNTLYAGIASFNGATLLGMYKTTDGAQNWTRLSMPDYCTPQCSYNNVVRVHPANPNVVVAAGLPPYRSLDGGVTWANIAVGVTGIGDHTDHHALAFAADGSKLYSGDDGGVWSVSNLTVPVASLVVWTNLNATLAITEFSSNVSIHPADPHIAYGGTQDNGTQYYSGKLTWDAVVGGDGGWTAIDPAIPGIWYGAFQGPQIYKTNGLAFNGGGLSTFTLTFPILWNGIFLTDRISSYPPILMNPSNPMWLYFAANRLYETFDGAGTWNLLSPDMTAGTGTITAIGLSPAALLTAAVGSSDGRLHVNTNAGPGGFNSWADRSAGLPLRGVSQIVFDAVSPTKLYATFTGFYLPPAEGTPPAAADKPGHVFKSTDLGQTWTDITGELPDIPVNDIVLDPDIAGTIYLATDIGVFQSADDGQHWTTLSNGFPRVLVRALNLHRPSRTLRAVTYGRSMWDLSVPIAGTSLGPHIDSYSPAAVAPGSPVTVTGSNFGASSVIRWNGVDRATTFVSATTLRFTPAAADVSAGRATLLVFNPSAGGGLSNSVNVPVGAVPAISTSGISLAPTPAAGGVLVPGSIATLYGTSLAANTVAAAAGDLPYTLGGVTVQVNGYPAALYYVSPAQIDFQVPFELEGYNSATVSVLNGTLLSASVTVRVAVAAPALFSTNGSGMGQGAITIATSGVLAAPAGAFPGSRPASHGEPLSIYCTGMGPVSRIFGDGVPAPVSPVAITQFPTVTIGGVAAPVLFSGLAPGAVGLYQVNVLVPSGTPAGDAVPVVVTINGTNSNAVTVAVGQ